MFLVPTVVLWTQEVQMSVYRPDDGNRVGRKADATDSQIKAKVLTRLWAAS